MIRNEFANVYLFVAAIVKTSLLTGIGPGILGAAIIARRSRLKWPIVVGKIYKVVGYHTGDFVGQLLRIDHDVARFMVIDTLRPSTLRRIRNRCAFPWCVLKDLHEGDHEIPKMRIGGMLEIYWANAGFIEAADRERAS